MPDRLSHRQPQRRSLLALLKKASVEGSEIIEQIALNSVEAVDKAGETALHIACAKGFEQTATLLLKAGADVNARNARHSMPLHKAISQANSAPLVRLLIAHGAELNPESRAIASPLNSAISADLGEIAQLLVGAGADPRRTTMAGTCLHAAVQTKSLALCELVLTWPVEIEAENFIGETALSTAAFIGEVEIAKLLIRHGADPFRVGGCLMSPIQRLEDVGEYELAKLLAEEAGKSTRSVSARHSSSKG